MESLDQSLPAGSRIGKFVVSAVLGVGGFGITYRARDERLGVDVAIKEYLPLELALRDGTTRTVRPHASRQSDYHFGLDRFLEEARTLARFKHPNIVRVVDFLEENGTAYLVMEYEPGESLGAYLRRTGFRGGMPEPEIRRILDAVLSGLEAVHGAGLLHRDIKPDNVYLRTGGGSPLLIDFGSARYALGAQSRSMSAVVSMGYAPPEQYASRGASQGPWTDLYAVGATLYELVRGEHPPESPERSERLMNGDGDSLQPFDSRERSVYSAGLLGAIEKGLQIAWRQRPQTVAEFRKLLGSAASAELAHEPARTRTVGEQERFGIPGPIKTSRGQEDERLGEREGEPWITDTVSGDGPGPDISTVSAGASQAGDGRAAWMLGLLALVVAGLGLAYGLRDRAPASGDIPVVSGDTSGGAAAPSVGHPYRRRLKSGGEGPEMVVLAGGSYLRGSPEIEEGRDTDEGPQRQVTVRSFAMGVTELTFADWDRCVATGGCTHQPDDEGWGRGDRPVINVNWEDAQAYVRWLSGETGRRYRLPTEAEWEYAARAGTTTAYWWGEQFDGSRVNGRGTAGTDRWVNTSPVKSFSPHPWGLYDISGNVWEWVEDCYHDSFQGTPLDGSAVEVARCDVRVLRGGGWNVEPARLRSANRLGDLQTNRSIHFGFRLAEDL